MTETFATPRPDVFNGRIGSRVQLLRTVPAGEIGALVSGKLLSATATGITVGTQSGARHLTISDIVEITFFT